MMSGGGLLFGGRIADLLSRKRVFLTGLAVFTFASIVSGFAGGGTELITARAAQGLSAGLMTPAALSIIMTTYSGAQRRTGLALWGAVGSLGVAAGVLLGGALATWAGWQTIFWINAPIGAVAFLVGLEVVPQREDATRRAEPGCSRYRRCAGSVRVPADAGCAGRVRRCTCTTEPAHEAATWWPASSPHLCRLPRSGLPPGWRPYA